VRYWLMKTEPDEWSWAAQVKKGVEAWTGVRNHQAANNMKEMAKGDLCFFYHTGEEKRIAGVVEVVKPHYPDPTDADGRFVAVDVRALMPLVKPVSLAEIKARPQLEHLALVRHTRLSVMPIDAVSWAIICRMGGITP